MVFVQMLLREGGHAHTQRTLAMIPVERGCNHSPHNFFCVETNTTWCTACAGEEGTRLATALHRVGGWTAVMTPVTHLRRLVDEDLMKLRVALKCVDEGVASSQRDGAHMHPELALDREAEQCRKDVDAVLLRVVQHVQATRDRLYRDIDAAIAHRREAVATLKAIGHKLSASISEVERVSPYAAGVSPIAVLDDQQHPVDITGLVSAAQLLANVEERLVLDAETALGSMFPANSTVSVTRQLAKRDVITLPATNTELALLPFSLRLSRPLALTSELDGIVVKDTSGWRCAAPADGNGSRSASESHLAANSHTPASSGGLSDVVKDRRQSWRSFMGLGATNARRRNIRTPDVMTI